MADREVSSFTAVTPPWLQKSQQKQNQPGGQTQSSNQSSGGQQQNQQVGFQQKSSPLDYLNSANNLYGSFNKFTGNKPFYANGGASFVTTPGVTNAGSVASNLSGEFLANNPSFTSVATGGASTGGGFANGVKGSLASAGVGLVGGFLGDKLFGGEGGTGGGLGASIGFAAGGPIGAALGGLLGGAVGGLFGGGADNSYYGVYQGNRAKTGRDLTKFTTELGDISVWGHEQGAGAVKPSVKAFKDADAKVAQLLNDEQLGRVKNRLKKGIKTHWTRWTQNPQRAEVRLKRAFKDRYTAAAEGIDPAFGGTFSRIYDEKKALGALSTLSRVDEDRRNGRNIFAGKDVKNGQQAINHIAKTYGLDEEKPTLAKMPDKRPTEIPKPEGRPSFSYSPMHGMSSGNNVPGWEYQTSMMGIPGGWRKAHGYFGGYGSYSQILNQRQAQWDAKKKKLNQKNNKKLGAWEEKVLDAYVNNYQQGNQIGQSTVLKKSGENLMRTGIGRTGNPQGQSARSRNRLFGNVQQQSVKLNRAAQSENDSTNAGGLLSQSEVA